MNALPSSKNVGHTLRCELKSRSGLALGPLGAPEYESRVNSRSRVAPLTTFFCRFDHPGWWSLAERSMHGCLDAWTVQTRNGKCPGVPHISGTRCQGAASSSLISLNSHTRSPYPRKKNARDDLIHPPPASKKIFSTLGTARCNCLFARWPGQIGCWAFWQRR